MKKIIILILVGILPILSQAQFELTNFQDQTVPASPTTAALGEYGYAPVDLSSGQVNFSVPIYTIEGSSISLPISYSYRAGVRIKETSPYTGHGWSMLAGGVITRSINGAVDPTPRIPNSILTTGWTDEQAFDVYQKDLDAAPDTFNYNFMGYSGQFALEDDFETPYYVKEQRNWLVDVDFENDITIVTEDGTKYVFAALEKTLIDDDFHYAHADIIVAWHLTEIISARNDERIELNYYTESFGKPELKNNTLILNPVSKSIQTVPAINRGISYKPQRINEITLYKENIAINKVTFEANTLRKDLITVPGNNVYALSKISIFDDPQSAQPLKYFNIDIDHVDAIESKDNERLFLRSIQEFSGNGNSNKTPYQFEYINENSLPSRLTRKADHWGYYSQQNGTEFPYADKMNWRVAPSKVPSLTAEYGSLRKVTFPTGGYNIFNYENNQYEKENDSGSDEEPSNYLTKQMQLQWRGDEWYNYFERAGSNDETYDFLLETDQFVKLDMKLALEKGTGRQHRVLDRQEIQDYSISIVNTSNNREVFSAYFDYDEGSDDGIAMYVLADSFVTYKNPNQEQYADNPNDIPANQLNNLLNYHKGFVGCCGYITSNGAYNFYNEFLDSNMDDSPIIVGESLDRSLYLDLKEGNYRALITASSIDNDMINTSSEVSLRLSHYGDPDLNNDDGSVTVEDNLRLGGGIRVKSQIIGTANSESTTYYDYVIHDDYGRSTSKTSGQISAEPNIIEYTPSADFVYLVSEYIGQAWVWKEQSFGLDPSALWARVGGGKPNTSVFASYIELKTPLYSIKSEPYQLNNSWVTYSEVKVTNGEKNANAGFTLHKFHELGSVYQNFYNTFSIHDGTSTFDFKKFGGSSVPVTKSWPYTALLETNTNYLKPKSILRYKFNGANRNPTLIEKENYNYYNFTKDRLLTSSVQTVSHVAFVGTTYLERQHSLLKSKETITYDLEGNNPIKTKVDYEYNNPSHFFPTKIITTDSQGEKLIKKNKYNRDYIPSISAGNNSSITLQALANKNFYVPIEEQIWKGNDSDGYKLINGTLSIYDEVSSSSATNKLYQPIEILNLETNSISYNLDIVNNFNRSRFFDSVNWLNTVTNYNYTSNANLDYYANGNLKEISKPESISVTYIWGYNNQYPIAKIENATHSEVESTISTLNSSYNTLTKIQALSNADNDNCIDSGSCKEKNLRTALAALRSALPSNTRLTSYTYDPLVGITSLTDPKGYAMYYMYDDLNRLKQVKDANGKLLSENEYHYKGQQ